MCLPLTGYRNVINMKLKQFRREFVTQEIDKNFQLYPVSKAA